MLLKLDENLGRSHAEFLRSAGHEADRVHDEGISGASDVTLWKRVCAEGRLLITLDLDFADIRRYPPGSHPGILLLRPRSRSRPAVLRVPRRVFGERQLESLSGCLAVADETQSRIRRPASGSEA